MTNQPAPTRTIGPAAVIAIAAVLFVAILVLRLSITQTGFGFTQFLVIPIALLAIVFGARAGLAAAAAAFAFALATDPAQPIQPNVVGDVSRATAYFLLGGLVGLYSDRVRHGQQRLSISEARLSQSQRMAQLGSWQWDIEADTVSWSEELYRLYGISPDELEPSYQGFLERVHPDDRKSTEEAIGRAHATGKPFDFDHRIVRPDGVVRVLHAHGEVALDEEEKPVAMAGTGQDVTELRRGEEAARLAAIVESSNDAIVGKRLDGTIVAWNKGAERMYDYPAAEALGKPISMLAVAKSEDEMPMILERIRRGEVVDPYETARRTKDGRRLDVSLTVSPVRNDEGRITGASAIAKDITESKRAERELRRLSAELGQRVRELAAANQELEAFSYSVSHDLRAPLRAIDGFSRAVIEDYADRLDEKGRAMLEDVRLGSQRMGRLIDELLTLSRLNRKELTTSSVNLSALAGEIGEDLEGQNPDRHVDLVVEDGLVAEGDPELLEVALRNLLENAWKFTGESSQPRIEFHQVADNGNTAYVVRDNGAGFDMRYSEKLFRPFERLHREDEYPGVGVGLATVQRVVRRHGGTVWAEGQIGQGAAFFFDLKEGSP